MIAGLAGLVIAVVGLYWMFSDWAGGKAAPWPKGKHWYGF
jgi:hypothetical protein